MTFQIEIDTKGNPWIVHKIGRELKEQELEVEKVLHAVLNQVNVKDALREAVNG